jgi:hypothetical protein
MPMTPRRLLILVATATAVMTIAGCAPETAPTPTPTGFASEEEAFAAAEETYRAYIDATNAVALDDPDTFKDVYEWTIEDENADVRTSFSQMHADGWVVAGQTQYDTFEGSTFDRAVGVVAAQLCLDVSDVAVTDSEGNSLVTEERLDRQPLTVTFKPSATPTSLAVAASETAQEYQC